MKLKSFGCSFVYGSDLSDPLLSWPSLLANQLGMEYECYAAPGLGNLQILESLLGQSQHSADSLFVINWTWIDRFDFINIETEKWETLRPSLDHIHADHYYRHLHSQYRDMLTNLIYVKSAIDFLLEKNIKFIMTYMDYLLFEKVNPNWHKKEPVDYLQKNTAPYLTDFSGKNFLDWSRSQGFEISDTWHPLEKSHAAAAELMLPFAKTILGKP